MRRAGGDALAASVYKYGNHLTPGHLRGDGGRIPRAVLEVEVRDGAADRFRFVWAESRSENPPDCREAFQ